MEKSTGRNEVLSRGDVARLAKLGGVAFSTTSPFTHVPQTTECTPEEALRRRGLLDDEWRHAFRALASPDHQVRVIVPGEKESVISVYYVSREVDRDLLVACASTNGGLRVSFPWDARSVASIAALAVLSASALPPLNPVKLTVSPGGLAALVAALDVIRSLSLDSMRSRKPVSDYRFTIEALEDQIALGSKVTDPRWIVSLVDIASPSILPLQSGGIAAGVEELISVGLLGREGDRLVPRGLLHGLAEDWREPLRAVAYEVITLNGGGVEQFEHRLAIRGRGSLWTVDYRDLHIGEPKIALECRDAGDYLEELIHFVRPPAAEPTLVTENVLPQSAPGGEAARRFCTACGGEVGMADSFCARCGVATGVEAATSSPPSPKEPAAGKHEGEGVETRAAPTPSGVANGVDSAAASTRRTPGLGVWWGGVGTSTVATVLLSAANPNDGLGISVTVAIPFVTLLLAVLCPPRPAVAAGFALGAQSLTLAGAALSGGGLASGVFLIRIVIGALNGGVCALVAAWRRRRRGASKQPPSTPTQASARPRLPERDGPPPEQREEGRGTESEKTPSRFKKWLEPTWVKVLLVLLGFGALRYFSKALGEILRDMF